MFLKYLYANSKTRFVLFMIITASFIFLNIKWGAVATPLYQYGMFSGRMYPADTQKIYHIYVNDKLVDLNTITQAKKDLLFITLEKFEKEKEINDLVFISMQKIFSYAGVGSFMKENNYKNNIPDQLFAHYYQKLLQDVLDYHIVKTSIYSQLYRWHSGKFLPASSPEKLPFFVTE